MSIDTFLAIDPGTVTTGIAVFEGGEPSYTASVSADPKQPPHKRIATIVEFLEGFLLSRTDIRAVACEKWAGNINPSLRTLITSLGQMVRTQRRRWHLYHNATVKRHCQPRCMSYTRPRRGDGQAKDLIRSGVMLLYPECGDKPQDEVDAVAVGHCHLSVMREKEILEGVR